MLRANTKRLNAEIPTDLLQGVKAQLALENKSIKELIIELLSIWLKSREKNT